MCSRVMMPKAPGKVRPVRISPSSSPPVAGAAVTPAGGGRGHLFHTGDQDEVVETEGDPEEPLAERDAARGAGALHLRGGDAREPEAVGDEAGQSPLARAPLPRAKPPG